MPRVDESDAALRKLREHRDVRVATEPEDAFDAAIFEELLEAKYGLARQDPVYLIAAANPCGILLLPSLVASYLATAAPPGRYA